MAKNVLRVIVLLAAGAAAAAAAAGGCESAACVKDTDCQMPLVCVSSACVPVPQKTDAPTGPDADADGDEDGRPGDDGTADADADADADEDGGDDGTADADGDEDGETTPCTPVLNDARKILDPTAADGQERALMVASDLGDRGRFVFFGRAQAGDGSDGLRFQRVGTSAALASGAVTSLSGVQIGPIHPLVELPGGSFAIGFTVVEGPTAGLYLKNVGSSGSGGDPAVIVPGTSNLSMEPSLTYDGANLVMAWSEHPAGAVEIRVGKFSPSTLAPTGGPVTVATGTAGTREPRILWGGDRHALVYFSADDGSVHFVTLDVNLGTMSDNAVAPGPTHTLSGYPAIAWNGSSFAAVWESAGSGSSTMHLTTFAPGSVPADSTPLAGTTLASTESGQIAIAWADDLREWGIAWRYTRETGTNVAVARISNELPPTLIEGPVVINAASTSAFYPSIAFNDGFYGLAWIEQVGSNYPGFETTRGCAP